jgi:glycosyltransferase involved in cell wall biosynthesis
MLEIDTQLRRSGRRQLVDLTFYAAVDYTPSPPAMHELIEAVDRVVPATSFAALAIGDPVTHPIPHGVVTTMFHPLGPAERRAARARELGAADETVVGYFGRNSHHKRPDLALRAFAHLATGAWASCAACGTTTTAEVGCDGGFLPVGRCRRCGSGRVDDADPNPGAVLFMHTDLPDERERTMSGGFDLQVLARRYGVADRVRFDRSLGVGRGVAVERLAARMAAVDLHLLLCDGGGWELTVLETGACGVANIVTDYAGPATYAAPFSRLVPVGSQLIQPYGVEGVPDLDAAVDALVDLTNQPERRAELAAAGPPTAARYSWPQVGDRWHELLVEVTA